MKKATIINRPLISITTLTAQILILSIILSLFYIKTLPLERINEITFALITSVIIHFCYYIINIILPKKDISIIVNALGTTTFVVLILFSTMIMKGLEFSAEGNEVAIGIWRLILVVPFITAIWIIILGFFEQKFRV